MAINYEIEVEGELLKVTASGFDESLEQVVFYGMAVLEAAIEHRCPHVICDERELEYRLSTLDTFDLAAQIAAHTPKIARVAVVCRPQDLADGTFFEDVAVNRGLTVRVFRTLEEAREWIDS